MKAHDFPEILLQTQPNNAEQFLRKRWEISNLPLAMGQNSLQHLFGDWQLKPLHTFRQGFWRTWIVRSVTDPVDKIVAHDFGVAVIQEAALRRPLAATERFQAH